MRFLFVLPFLFLGQTQSALAEDKCEVLSQAFIHLEYASEYLGKTAFSRTEDIQASTILVEGMIEEVQGAMNEYRCAPPSIGPTPLLPTGKCPAVVASRASLGKANIALRSASATIPYVRHTAAIGNATAAVLDALLVQKRCIPSTF